MQLHRTSPSLTTKLEGELFIVDITCAADGTYNKKMMFKYNGTSHLDEPGSYVASCINCYSYSQWHSQT